MNEPTSLMSTYLATSSSNPFSVPVLLELPVPVVEGADLPGLEPPRYAVEVEGMVAHAPRDCALLRRCRCLVRLALDAEIHDVVAADGTVVHHDVPRPKRHRVPFLYLEPVRVTKWFSFLSPTRIFLKLGPMNSSTYLFFSLLELEDEGISWSRSTSIFLGGRFLG